MDLTVNEVSVSRKPLLVFPKIKSHVTRFTFRTLNNLFPACIFGYCLKEISFYFTQVYPLNRPRNQQKVHTHTHTHTFQMERATDIRGVASSGSRGNPVWWEQKNQSWRAKDEELTETSESQIPAPIHSLLKSLDFRSVRIDPTYMLISNREVQRKM